MDLDWSGCAFTKNSPAYFGRNSRSDSNAKGSGFAKELGFERVLVEGDSEIIVNAICGKSLLSSVLGHILEDIHVLSSTFSSISFHHIKRLGNCVAHRLARRSSCNPLLVWMEEVPPDIVDVYNYDLSLLNG